MMVSELERHQYVASTMPHKTTLPRNGDGKRRIDYILYKPCQEVEMVWKFYKKEIQLQKNLSHWLATKLNKVRKKSRVYIFQGFGRSVKSWKTLVLIYTIFTNFCYDSRKYGFCSGGERLQVLHGPRNHERSHSRGHDVFMWTRFIVTVVISWKNVQFSCPVLFLLCENELDFCRYAFMWTLSRSSWCSWDFCISPQCSFLCVAMNLTSSQRDV